MEWRDVIVVGAGIAGLVTAYQLHKRGFKIALLEQQSQAGGVIRSATQDGFLLEYGPNSFSETMDMVHLVRELGLSAEFVSAPSQAPRYIFFRGALRAVPLNPGAFFISPLISWGAKLRLMAEPFIAARKEENEESIADFISRRLGREIHDRLVSPFVSGVYAGNTATLSMAASFPKLVEMETNHGSLLKGGLAMMRAARQQKGERASRRLSSFRNGLQTLPRALATRLGSVLTTNCSVREIIIKPHSPHYTLKCEQHDHHYQLTTDNLVLATPAYTAAKLLQPTIAALATELSNIEYTSLAVVHVSYDQAALKRPLHGFGFLVPRSENIRLLGTIWNSSLFPARAPQDKVLLTNFIGGAHDPTAVDLSDAALSNLLNGELQKILATDALAEVINITRLKPAIPQFTLGHSARVARITAQLHTHTGLHLVGNYLQGVSLPDCVSRANLLATTMALQLPLPLGK